MLPGPRDRGLIRTLIVDKGREEERLNRPDCTLCISYIGSEGQHDIADR